MKKILLLLLAAFVLVGESAFARETIAILGDSYSTFEGFIPPQNAIWYFSKPDRNLTDVDDVTQTWWWKTIKEGGYKLGVNDSWSGSTICNTGYDDADYSDRSFMSRITKLGDPDIILIFGGTNDSWCGAATGEYKYGDFKRGDLYFYRPALAKLLNDATKHYPNVRIIFIVNSELRPEITESTRKICDHYGVECLELHDIEKQSGHPNQKGMASISEQVLKVLKK